MDHGQFWLHDQDADLEQVGTMWDRLQIDARLVVGDKLIAIATVRNWYALTDIAITETEQPLGDLTEWDHVSECSICLSSGVLVIHDAILCIEPLKQLDVLPGWHRARVYHGDLSKQYTALEGDDHYKVVLWLSEQAPQLIIKCFGPEKEFAL